MSRSNHFMSAFLPPMALAAASLFAFQAQADSAAAVTPMTTREMQTAVIGNSISGETEDGDSFAEYYAPDGTIHGVSKRNGAYRGAWHFRQDQVMCFKYGEGPFDGGCVHLALDGNKLAFIRIDGTTEPSVRLIKGNPNDL